MSSKAKGNSFERMICKRLSQWWSGDKEISDLFWRTASSGGRATQRSKTQQRTHGHYGDICSTHPSSALLLELLTLEVKRGYNKATLHDLLDRTPSAAQQIYEEWITKARRDATASGVEYWALIHRRDRRETMVLYPQSLGAVLPALLPAPNGPSPLLCACVKVGEEWETLCLTTFDEWLRLVDPERIRSLVTPHA